MQRLKTDVVSKLLQLAVQLLDESEDLTEQPDNQQLWYNRGYAVGILETITALEDDATIPATVQSRLDAHRQAIDEHRMLPWGKAYRHGEEKGASEATEVLGE